MLTRLVHDGVRTTPFALENWPIAGWNLKSQSVPERDTFVRDGSIQWLGQTPSIRNVQADSLETVVEELILRDEKSWNAAQLSQQTQNQHSAAE